MQPSDAEPAYLFELSETTLADRVVPVPGESQLSLLMRLAEASGHVSITVLEPRLGVAANTIQQVPWQPEVIPAFAAMAGLPLNEISGRAYSPVEIDGVERAHVTFHDLYLRSDHVSTRRRAVSPASLRKAPVHRMIWDVVPLGFCPESLELLIDRCPSTSCGKKLKWAGASVCRCHSCGFDLREAKTTTISDADARALLPIAQLLSQDPHVRAHARACISHDLQNSSVSDLIYCADLLGLALSYGSSADKTAQRIKSHHGEPVERLVDQIGNGAYLIHDLNEYFDDFLDESRSSSRRSISYSALRNELGLVYDLTVESVVGREIASAMNARIGRYYQNLYRKSRRAIHNSILLKYVPDVISYDELIASAPTKILGKKLAALDDCRVGSGPHNRILCFDRQAVQAAFDVLDDAVSISRLCSEVGLTTEVMRFIISEGWVQMCGRPVPQVVGRDQVSRKSWNAFIARFEPDQSRLNNDLIPLKSVVSRHGYAAKHWKDALTLIVSGAYLIVGVDRSSSKLSARWYLSRKAVQSSILSATGGRMPMLSVVAKDLGVKTDKLFEMYRSGYIEAEHADASRSVILVSRESVENFKLDYVTLVELADRFDTSTRMVATWLGRSDIKPVGRRRPMTYVRKEVENLIAQGVSEYGRLSQKLNDGYVFFAQLYNLPKNIRTKDIVFSAESCEPVKRWNLLIIADLLNGLSLREAIRRRGSGTLNTEFINKVSHSGLDRLLLVRTTKKSKLNVSQRRIFEDETNRLLRLKRNGDHSVTIDTLIAFIKAEFGVDYEKSSLYAYLKRANIPFAEKFVPPGCLSQEQQAQLCVYAKQVAERITTGDKGLGRKTIVTWIKDTFNADVSLSTVGKYLKSGNVKWPSTKGRKLSPKTSNTCCVQKT